MPLLCNYYVTLRCNARCGFCDIWKHSAGKSRKPREQTMPEVRANLAGLRRMGVRFIDFTGGEPLLYPNLAEALGIAKRMGFFTTVTTNCMLYPEHAEQLAGLVDMLYFSLQSADRAEHNRITGSKSYDKVMESMEIASRLGGKPIILHTVTDENFSGLDAMVRLAQHKRIALKINPCFGYFGNRGLAPALARGLMKHFWEPYVLLNPAIVRLIEKGGNNPARPAYNAVSSCVTISPDNRLMLPCFHRCKEALEINGNLAGLYESAKARHYRKIEGRFGFCKGCTINCYMRASLFRRMPRLYIMYALKFLAESIRASHGSQRNSATLNWNEWQPQALQSGLDGNKRQ
jgi:organic radical activating enzyme